MRRRSVWLWLAVIGLVLVLAVAPATTPRADAAPAATVSAVTTDCPVEVPDEPAVTCGLLTVPEDHDQPDGPTIRLPYIILHSPYDDPEPDPVVYTDGGPGYSSLNSVWGFADSPLLANRDIIIVEQRGNRYAQPSLACDGSVWFDEAPGHTPCLDSIRFRGIDLSSYTTDSMVRDFIALRQALGLEQWNLYGTSFSTSLMLLLLEADPDASRSAILQSVKPPSETTFAHEADSPLRAIEHIFETCDGDERCRAAFPDLEDRFFGLIRRLNRTPVEVEFEPAGGGGPIPLEWDGDRFIDWIMINYLYQPAFPPSVTAYLPLLISEVDDGNTAPLEPAAAAFWNSTFTNPAWSWGLLLAVNCQQDLPAAGGERPDADRAASARLDGFYRSTSQRNICEAWDLDPQDPAGDDYVRSDIPALVLVGAFDPVTPPVWSRTTAEYLTNSTYVEFPGHGHNVTVDNPCSGQLQAAFVADPTAALDTGCVASAPKPEFMTPDDIYLNSKLAQSRDEVSLGEPQGVAWLEALAAVSLIGMLALLAVLIVGGGLWLWRRTRQDDPEIRRPSSGWTVPAAYGLSVAVVVATLAIPILLTEINQAYPDAGDVGYLLGPSRDLVAATLVAWITPLTGIMVIALGALVVWAVFTGRWRRLFAATTTLVVVFALPMMYLSLRWGLFTML